MQNKVPVQQGKQYEIQISSMGHSGEGVGRSEGFTVFVDGALPGETVLVQILQVKKNYAKGKLVKVLQGSTERIEPRCSDYEQCGGCQLQHLSYNEQLVWKRQIVEDNLKRIGKLQGVVVHPTLGAVDPWYYRNKMQFPVGLHKGSLAIGCYAQGTHHIIDTQHCYIQHQTNNDIAMVVKEIAVKLGIAPYDEKTGQGVLRHVLGRVGIHTGEIMVVLVTKTEQMPHKQQFIQAITEKIPSITSIVQNVNPKNTNVILGDKTTTLWGKDTITDQLGRFRFAISARSFFQVNTVQAEVLYKKAVDFADLTGTETVIDAYCGTGTISLFLADKAQKVIGIEVVPEAIADAKQNAVNNGVTNVDFIVGDTVEEMPKLYKEGLKPEIIVVDPPRRGCEPQVLDAFVGMQPKRIVYVSCNPSSLARDLAYLQDKGYETKEVQPVDMFSQTFHVECVALIECE